MSELLDLELGGVAAGGACVGRAPDGRVVFVRHGLPGERVRARVTGETAHFKFADPASPTLVLDPGDPGVQYVLMPLRV